LDELIDVWYELNALVNQRYLMLRFLPDRTPEPCGGWAGISESLSSRAMVEGVVDTLERQLARLRALGRHAADEGNV
jgi:hypothetical protein